MILVPQNPQQFKLMADFMLAKAYVQPSMDARYIAWTDPGGSRLKMVVAFTAFVGTTCQIHVALTGDYKFTPRKMLEAAFDYAFNQAGRDLLIGIVNSKNEAAMRYDRHLGFSESHRLPGVHDDGGDIVIFTMNRNQCRYLKAQVKEAA
jgi:hypothetical protein